MMADVLVSFAFLFFLILCTLKYKSSSFVYVYALWYVLILIDYACMQSVFVPFSKKFDLFFFYFSLLFIVMYLLFDTIITFTGKISFPHIHFFSYHYYRLFSLLVASISIFLCLKSFLTMPVLIVRSKIAASELSFHVGISFPFISSCLFYQNKTGINKHKTLLSIVLFLLAAISSSKQFIVLAFLFTVPWYVRGFKLRLWIIAVLGAFGFLLIMLLHALTGRVAGSGNLVQKTIYTINGYLLGGIAVFQLFLDGTMHSHITSGSWVKTGKWIGNVYSGFYSFYRDYNVLWLSLKIISISALYAFVNVKRKSLFSQFLRVYSIYPLLFFIFSDLFFPAIAQWSAFAVAGICVSCICPKRELAL